VAPGRADALTDGLPATLSRKAVETALRGSIGYRALVPPG
jgi:hypothetical protein